MVTDHQVLLLRRRIMEGKTQQASAAAAGMSARGARRWRSGPLPSEKKKRSWRTRPDAFSGVWCEILSWLQHKPDAAATSCSVG
ncbi:MAG: hypothetical protein OXD31_16390 [Chloroflexi bacterium]|nr:hypothetical protein [Chloroflexota bacterium]